MRSEDIDPVLLAEEMHKRGMIVIMPIYNRRGDEYQYIISPIRRNELLQENEIERLCCVCGRAVVHRLPAPRQAAPICPEHAVELQNRRGQA